MTIRKIAAAAALAGTVALAIPTHAATDAGTVQVSATLTAACFIGDGTLSFGNVVSIGEGGTAGTKAAASDAAADTGAINYVCSNGATAALGITGANDSVDQLQMANGTDRLAYNIYTDGAHTVPVTPGTPTVPLTADGTDQTITLYGVVPGLTANQPIGNYTDTLTLTVAY